MNNNDWSSQLLDDDSVMATNDLDRSSQQQQQQQQQQTPIRAPKRRAEELHESLNNSTRTMLGVGVKSSTQMSIQRAASRDMGVQGLEVSDFEQMKPSESSNMNNTATIDENENNDNNNSYFCIGSGAGCVDRSVSQTCLTRELEQLPMYHREHVGQDLYGLAEECIPTADESLLDELEAAIVTLLEKGDSKASSSSSFGTLASSTTGIGGISNINSNSGNTGMQIPMRRGTLPITRSTPELQSLVPYHAYRLAVSMSPSYVRNPEFRLMFLRATEGDVKKAAKRLTRHFKTKLRLFGEDKLVRDIVLDDLSEDDMESLKSGGFQVLSKRDAAGRLVLFGRYTSMKYKAIDNMLRALWYIWMSIVEDPISQKKGVVALGYEVGRLPLDRFDGMEDCDGLAGFELADDLSDHNMSGGFDRTLAREIVSVPLSIPARPVGYHLCTDSHQWVGMLNMVMVTLCKFIRLRMRIHHGTDLECKYALMTHGMPTDSVPVDDTGFMSLTQHLEWIEGRKILDAQKRMGQQTRY
mmetsp:Transcript_20238/g.44052  ORF Transcript_20238/g.44052 Transcript_20238/m.44052 type:complete len:526 (-) Transcript_20238:44-1621(-)